MLPPQAWRVPANQQRQAADVRQGTGSTINAGEHPGQTPKLTTGFGVMPLSLYSTAAAAKELGVSKKTLLKWCREKRIAHIRYPSGAIKFREETLNFFLGHHTVPATNAPPQRRAA